jgi:LPS export ABC transporter protein LptC
MNNAFPTKVMYIVLSVAIIAFVMAMAKEKFNEVKVTQPHFATQLVDPVLIGRYNGEKMWELRAKTMVTSPDGQSTTLEGIFDGVFYANGNKRALFTAGEAQYDRANGDLLLKRGLQLTKLDDMTISLGHARWMGKSQVFKSEGPVQVVGKDFNMEAGRLAGEKGIQKITLEGDVRITTNEGASIKADKGYYEEREKRFLLEGPVSLEIKPREEKIPSIVGNTTKLEFSTDTKQIVAPETVRLKSQDYHFTTRQALYDEKSKIFRLKEVHATGAGKETIEAAVMLLYTETEMLEAENVALTFENSEAVPNYIGNETIYMKADTVWVGGKKDTYWGMAKNVVVERINGDTLRAPRAQISQRDKTINLIGKMIFRQGNGDYEVAADMAEYYWEPELVKAVGTLQMFHRDGTVVIAEKAEIDCRKEVVTMYDNLKMTDKEGTVVTAENLRYDHYTKKITISGNVKVDYTNGRWLTTDTMVYDTDTGDAEFEGHIEAGIGKH